MPNGGKYWRYDYSFKDKRRTLAFGVYPDVSLGKARARHHDARRMLAAGTDPGSMMRPAGRDFETVAREWLAHWRTGRSERYVGFVITRLENDVFPEIGSRPASEITAVEFRNVALKIERRGALEMARRLLQNCGQIMRYSVANDLVLRNPVADIRPADILKSRKKRNYLEPRARMMQAWADHLDQLRSQQVGALNGEGLRVPAAHIGNNNLAPDRP
jgi:hypothetical protein